VDAAPSNADVERLLARYAPERPPLPTAGAAVTLVLRSGLTDVEVLLIERATNPTDPASGEVGLPGGHVSETDDSLAETAARELREEVGLTLEDLQGPLVFVGVQPAPRFSLHVGVFAAALGPSRPTRLAPDPTEVAHVFWLPRGALEPSVRIRRDTPRGTIDVPATVHEGHVLWGFTRRVVRQFFELPVEDRSGGPPFAPPPTREPGAGDAPSPPPSFK
jgi:8-oxo-dGTP pyrophosphatase MutT (NUDIX family)